MKKALSFLLAAGMVFSASVMSFGNETQAESSADAAEAVESVAAEEAAVEEAAGEEAAVEEAAGEEAAAEEAAGEEAAAEEADGEEAAVEEADGEEAAVEEAAGEEAAGEEAAGEEAAGEEAGASGAGSSSEYVQLIDAPEPVQTSHSAMINGQQIDYTAEVGSFEFASGDSQCKMVYTAYIKDDVEDKSERPITFAYNGGPGAGSACVNLLFVGPRMIELDDEGNSVSLPAKLVDNEYSLLDLTDLVIVDVVGTGYSRASEGTDPNDFYGYEGDCTAVGNFIWLYLNNKGRWSSPKYLLGESYGTIRSMGVCEYLNNAFSLPLNGLIQVSSVHDYSMLLANTTADSAYVRFLPTFAADAWYHKKVNETYQNMELEDFLSEVCTFADTEYVSALNRGDTLTDEEFNAAAEKISGYIGLDVNYVKQHRLRIQMVEFITELLKDQNLIIGRMDGKVTGPTAASDAAGDNDPSFKSVISDLGSVTNQYYNDELEYHSDIPYKQINYDVNYAWTYPGNAVEVFDQSPTIYSNISMNRYLKVWVLCGYYDLATPFHGAEWIYDHLGLNEDCRNQVQFTYYKGGHMFYLDPEDHAKVHQDAEAWFKS